MKSMFERRNFAEDVAALYTFRADANPGSRFRTAGAIVRWLELDEGWPNHFIGSAKDYEDRQRYVADRREYAEALEAALALKDDARRDAFFVFGTETGRTSSSQPNIANIRRSR